MVEALSPGEIMLELDHEIRVTEMGLSLAKRRRSLGNFCLITGPILGVIATILGSIPGLGRHPVTVAALAIVVPLALFLFFKGVHYKVAPGGPFKDGTTTWEPLEKKARWTEREIELQLAKLRDKRKLNATHDQIDVNKRRAAYKADAYHDIQRFRQEGNSYRRISNTLQAILIVGSFVTTGTAGVGLFEHAFQWGTVATSFAVGIASGFLGYFKYRERTAYLQQTADAIESELEAFELGIGRYKNYTKEQEEKALGDFVEEVYRLKSEQKKRQQNLDQPAEEKTQSTVTAE
jgi:hypothetical protein